MANAERLQYLAAWIQQRVAEINVLVAQADTPEGLRQALAAADELVSRLRVERRAVTAELGQIQERLDIGGPARNATWLRVKADLLADQARFEQALAGLEAQIQEQERFRRGIRSELAKPTGVPVRARAIILPAAAEQPETGRRVAGGLRRLAILVGGGISVLLLLCGILASRPPSASVGQQLLQAAPTVTASLEVGATEAADLTPRRAESEPATVAPPEPTAAPAVPTASATAAPTSAPSPTETPIPLPAAAKDANLRGGPGTNYPLVGGVRAGEALEVVERNATGDWYRLASGAWIAAFLVKDVVQDLPVAAVIPAPPTAKPPPIVQPTATPLPVRAVTIPTSAPAQPNFSGCCKVCSASKACGDSCISWSKACHKGPGCACQG